MTIFMKILLEILQKKMNEGLNGSIQADAGMMNQVLSCFGSGRDKTISQEKQNKMQEYLYLLTHFVIKKSDVLQLPKVTSLKPEQIKQIECSNSLALIILNDDVTESAQQVMQTAKTSPNRSLRQLVDEYYAQGTNDELKSRAVSILIRNCQLEIRHKGKLAGFDQTNIGRALDECHRYIRLLKSELEPAHLLDMPYEEDNAYHQMVWQLGRYLWHTVVENSALAEEKKKLVLDVLASCQQSLIDLKHDKNTLTYKKMVIQSLQELRRANNELCNESGLPISAPLSLTFFATVSVNTSLFIPNLGELERCASHAIQAIKEIQKMQDGQQIEYATDLSSSSSSAMSEYSV